jgi:predicted TPR repeat methyltransferase
MSSKLNLRRKKWGKRKKTMPANGTVASAVAKHQQGEIDEAVVIYRQVLAAAPDHVDALHFLGVAEHQKGNSEKALEHIGRALALLPDQPDALNNRGNIFKTLGRLDEAEADYKRSLVLRPKDANALNNLGTVQRQRGDLENAVATFREVIALKPDHAGAWQNLGNALGGLDRLEEALDAHREAMRLAPQSPDSYHRLGLTLCTIGRTEEGFEVYRRWVALFPNDPHARHFAATCFGEKAPRRASDDYVRTEFDGFASTFDTTLARLEYRAPTLVAEEVARIFGQARSCLAVLDAGCGTGLCGPRLRPHASFLSGVDLSPGMVELARKRGVYDALVVEELTAHLRQNERSSDLIVSADTLVYFGDLAEVTAAAAKALRAGGALIFTVERATPEAAPDGYRINPHGRYSHTGDYLFRVLREAGLVDSTLTEVTLRKEAEKWVDGYLVSARRPTMVSNESSV